MIWVCGERRFTSAAPLKESRIFRSSGFARSTNRIESEPPKPVWIVSLLPVESGGGGGAAGPLTTTPSKRVPDRTPGRLPLLRTIVAVSPAATKEPADSTGDVDDMAPDQPAELAQVSFLKTSTTSGCPPWRSCPSTGVREPLTTRTSAPWAWGAVGELAQTPSIVISLPAPPVEKVW
jgi:hypothetical protein